MSDLRHEDDPIDVTDFFGPHDGTGPWSEYRLAADPAAEPVGAQVLAKPLTDLAGPWHVIGNAVDAPPHFDLTVPERQTQYRVVGIWEDETHGNEVVGPVCGDLEAALIELHRAFPEVDETWELFVEERVVTETSWKRSEVEVPEDPRDARIAELEAEVREWKGNHSGVVTAKRKLHQRFDDLFRAKSLPPLEALGELERLIRQLNPEYTVPDLRDGYDDARDDVIDLITDLAGELAWQKR